VSGDRGPDYCIQAATDLADPAAWVTLFTTNSPALPFAWWDLAATNAPTRFYRILLQP